MWNGKKRLKSVLTLEKGGLKMICIKSMVKAAKIMFIKRLLNTQDTKWKYISWLMFGINKNLLFFKNKFYIVKVNLSSPFYGQLLDIYGMN